MPTMGNRPKDTASVEHRKYSSTKEYWYNASPNKIDALRAIALASPAMDEGVDINGNTIALFKRSIVAREEGGPFTVIVGYENTPDQFDLKINNGVQSRRNMVDQETIRVYDCIDGSVVNGRGATANVPNFHGAIGVSGTGHDLKVEGVDAEFGKMEFSITKKIDSGVLSASYEAYVGTITPTVNDALWSFVWETQLFAFARGSVIFRGHTTDQSSTCLSLTHNFAFSPGIIPVTYPTWLIGTSYAAGVKASYLGVNYQSAYGPNLGQTPRDAVAWQESQDYAFGQCSTFGGHVYESLVDDNLAYQPDLFSGGANPPDKWQDLGLIAWIRLTDTSFRVGNSAPISKEGWHYGWPWFKPVVEHGCMISQPAGYVVSRIYDYSNFATLQCF